VPLVRVAEDGERGHHGHHREQHAESPRPPREWKATIVVDTGMSTAMTTKPFHDDHRDEEPRKGPKPISGRHLVKNCTALVTTRMTKVSAVYP